MKLKDLLDEERFISDDTRRLVDDGLPKTPDASIDYEEFGRRLAVGIAKGLVDPEHFSLSVAAEIVPYYFGFLMDGAKSRSPMLAGMLSSVELGEAAGKFLSGFLFKGDKNE